MWWKKRPGRKYEPNPNPITKNRIRKLLVGAALVGAATLVQAQFNYTDNGDGTCTITKYTGNAHTVTVPDSIAGLTVVSIGKGAFEFFQILNSVTFGNSVTSIATDAFGFCNNLTNVAMGNGVISIGNKAFYYCYHLPNVTIPASVTSIGTNAFSNCTGLTSITIPASVTNIGDSAFYFCTGLTNVTVGNSVTSIGTGAFRACDSLKAITVDAANSCYSSANGVLLNKNQTTLIQFPGGQGGSYAIPNNVTSIGDTAFRYCTNLTSVTIPKSVTYVGYEAFADCPGLTSAYFLGNAPYDGGAVFYALSGYDPVTAYYLPGATGWGPLFSGVPTDLWYLPTPLILTGDDSFGVLNNRFGFTISWATNVSVVVEACTNLANPIWTPLATNALVNGTNYFSDTTPPDLPKRFYRVRAQ